MNQIEFILTHYCVFCNYQNDLKKMWEIILTIPINIFCYNEEGLEGLGSIE